MSDLFFDCVVVGSGHAGSCAAISAVQSGCKKVLMIDKCPPSWVGGNGYFTAGAHRTVHSGLNDLLEIVKDVSADVVARIDVDAYTRDDFVGDIMRLGNGLPDVGLVHAMVDGSREAVGWLVETVGVPFVFSFHRQAYEVAGRQKFWGGMALSVQHGGKGLIAAHQSTLGRFGVEVWFDASCVELLLDIDKEAVTGLVVRRDGVDLTVRTHAVILAAGGFEASPELRRDYLGSGWERAKVRGTPYNTGEVIFLARDVGAKLTGDWKGCHSTAWDANAADGAGDRVLTNQYTKSGYPLGVMVNASGKRFVDEGEDFRNYTYAKFGKAILMQPGGYAFQVWDKKVIGSLRKDEYDKGVVERITANTLPELADALGASGLEDTAGFLQTLDTFNDATHRYQREHPEGVWDPARKDGLSTQSTRTSLEIPKSNWALPIEEPPFLAVKVACGVTFTFGGLAIDPQTAGVILRKTDHVIEGLFCTGEMVGGLFHRNYPGGSGLTAGTVFGRKAGLSAGERVRTLG